MNRNARVDGMRFLFCTVGFLFHSSPKFYWLASYLLPGFFSLSGFAIARQLLNSEVSNSLTLKNFFIRRFLRIVPPFYMTLLLMSVFGLVVYPLWSFSFLYNIKYYLLTINGELTNHNEFTKHILVSEGHTWTVALEEQFYLICPFLILFLSKWKRVAVILVALVGCMAFVQWHIANNSPGSYSVLLPGSGEYFLWGILAAIANKKHKFNPRFYKWITGIGAFMVAGVMITHGIFPQSADTLPAVRSSNYRFPLEIGFALYFWGLFYIDSKWLDRLIGNKIFKSGGLISYSFYLVHVPIIALVFKHSPIDSFIVNSIFAYVFTLLLSWAYWISFEKRLNSIKFNYKISTRP